MGLHLVSQDMALLSVYTFWGSASVLLLYPFGECLVYGSDILSFRAISHDATFMEYGAAKLGAKSKWNKSKINLPPCLRVMCHVLRVSECQRPSPASLSTFTSSHNSHCK